MRKILFFMIVFSFAITASANTKPALDKRYEKVIFPVKCNMASIEKIAMSNLLAIRKSLCHVCCTFTATSMDGEQNVTRSACAGNLFTSCERAGNTACTRARLAALTAVF
jgi:hypothetical protein